MSRDTDGFERLFDQLVSAWDTHQMLRRVSAPLPKLAESACRLYDARLAMAHWHRHHQAR